MTEPPDGGSRPPRRLDVVVWLGPGRGCAPARLTIRRPGATVADLAEQLGAGWTWLAVDGRPCSPTSPLTEAAIRRGSLIAVPPEPAGAAGMPSGQPYLLAETGIDAARFYPLEIGAFTAGRDIRHPVALAADAGASRDHCRFDVGPDGSVSVTDLGSTNGTLLNGRSLDGPARLAPGDRVTVGSTVLCYGRAPEATTPPAEPFRRPPRRLTVEPLAPVAVPDPPEVRDPRPAVPVVAFVTPLLFAAVMIWVLHSWIYAAFGLLSPIAAGGTWIDGRRRYRRAKRGETAATRAALDRLAEDLEAQRRQAVEQLHAAAGAPGALREAAERAEPMLWERRPGHPDFLEVRLATGHLRFSPVTTGRAAPTEAAAEVIDAVAERGLDVASLRLAGRWVGIWGERDAALAVARSLLLQAASTSGPADLTLRLAVGDAHRPDWAWVGWLPHAVTEEDGTPSRPVGRDRRRGSDQPPGPVELLVADEPDGALEDLPSTGLAVAGDFHRLPDECQVIVHVDRHGVLSVEDLTSRASAGQLLACGVAADVADAWARSLAPVDDDDLPAGHLPDLVLGTDLWLGEATPGLAWPVGESRHGPVILDLDGREPHVVIAGVAGSGRTEALAGMIAALSVYSPDQVNVAVLDLSGGDLAKLAAFPQVTGVATDIGSARSPEGPLARLEAEVLRRDRLLRSGGFESAAAYRAAGGPDLPYLVVAVDDPGTLGVEATAALEAVVRLTAGAVHLGLRAVLATTQPAGRAASLLRNAAARLALRLDPRSAEELVGVTHPANLPVTRPGRGWLRVADRPPLPIQLAACSVPAPPPGVGVEVDVVGAPVPAADPRPAVLAAMLEQARDRYPARARPLWGVTESAQAAAAGTTLATLLGVEDLGSPDLQKLWSERPMGEYLTAPIGVDDHGQPLWLDLKEAAYGGMGPHGLVVGATGSGKSELLRTLVSALVGRHPPDLLSLVLVDFKGGATFAGFAGLPHVAGMITNLEADLSNVDRMEAALLGEQQRRQELLRRAGNLGSAEAYRQVRRSRPDLPPLPDMLLVVDEFAELLEQRPEFISMFGSIGRLGRSLGVHLLLATQRLEEGRLRGLESHLRYRISLRTNSAAESRAVLGVADASTLPSEPGVGYIRVDEPRLQRFRAAMVSASPEAAADGVASDMDVLVEALRPAAPPTHQVWLPVLPQALSLGRLLGSVAPVPGRGLQATDWRTPGSQSAPVGVIDRPRLQTRGALVVDFSGATGNLAVVGSPLSGKTTLLRTLAAAMALSHTPREIHMYALDFAGGGLISLAGLPHVGGVAHQGDRELVQRTVSHVAGFVTRREEQFRRLGILSVEHFRRMRSDGSLPEGDHGDVYLLIDGWDGVRSFSETLEEQITDLARRGLAVGVHVVIASSRWPVVRPALRDAVLGRLELRQSEPFESLFDRRAAENVPVGRPGRGITESGEHFLAALPTLEVRPADDAGWARLVEAVAESWPGEPAPPVRVLPAVVRRSDLSPADGLAVGVAEPDMEPFGLDLDGADRHLLVLGDSRSGKTTFLRTLLAQLVDRHGPDRARVLVADPRRGLLDAVPAGQRFGYAGSAPAAATEIARFREALDRRMPGPDLTVQQLKDRSWWTGPEAYLVVDDHDLIVTATSNPLLPVLDLLAQASDVGLHVILARRVAGWQRAQYEPVIQRLREVSATVLVLSGDPSEGLITGAVRAVPRPPGRATLARYHRPPVTVQLAC